MTIPRIIHFVWFRIGNGPANPPEKYQNMINTWSKFNPGWKVIVWNEEKTLELLKRDYPTYVEMFEKYKRDIFRIDAARYFILHKYGGFYSDCDITCHANIENLRNHKVVLSVDKYTKTVNNNHFMGAVPSSPFFSQCIQNLQLASKLQIKEPSYVATFSVAGPFYLTTQKTIFKPKNDLYIMSLEEENTYFVHHEANSWNMVKGIGGDLMRTGIVAAFIIFAGTLIKSAFQKSETL